MVYSDKAVRFRLGFVWSPKLKNTPGQTASKRRWTILVVATLPEWICLHQQIKDFALSGTRLYLRQPRWRSLWQRQVESGSIAPKSGMFQSVAKPSRGDALLLQLKDKAEWGVGSTGLQAEARRQSKPNNDSSRSELRGNQCKG